MSGTTRTVTAPNPVLWADYPDPDVIRVGDAWYMVSTTMHMFPGCVILRSYNLLQWETVCHVYDALGETPAQQLTGGNIYGKGMWAACLRYHRGRFHIVFCANDTHVMYHYTSEDIAGPWTRQEMTGFYHDCSVLFDDDDRVYIVYGNRQIHLTELTEDLARPKEGGTDRVIVEDAPEVPLGYEGSHLYKINGRYYLFLIHWPATGTRRRTEAVFTADAPEGPWTGGDCLDDDMGFHNMGVAQGGIVDTPDGSWYAMLFQDHGAVGRIPVLVPARFENGSVCMGPVPSQWTLPDYRPGHCYQPLADSDDFSSSRLRNIWQWNHEPVLSLIHTDPGKKVLTIKTDRVVGELPESVNTLTQRTFGPGVRAEVTVDGRALLEGDIAGLCALQGFYAQIGLARDADGYRILWRMRDEEGVHEESMPCLSDCVRLAATFDFRDLKDEVCFYVERDGQWEQAGRPHHLVYRLDHFMGVRVGLYCYSTQKAGGAAGFSSFTYQV